MRMSAAIATGRVLIAPQPGAIFGNNDSGCALGMALRAVNSNEADSIAELWPWTLEVRGFHPCGCTRLNCSPFNVNPGAQSIAHMFDKHVFGDCTWTLDQLIDWVRSVEPVEPEEHMETVQLQPEHNLVGTPPPADLLKESNERREYALKE